MDLIGFGNIKFNLEEHKIASGLRKTQLSDLEIERYSRPYAFRKFEKQYLFRCFQKSQFQMETNFTDFESCKILEIRGE